MLVKELKKEIKLKKLDFCNPINLIENMEEGFYNALIERRVKIRKFNIPNTPGIYIFFNKYMEVMYIGKSVNLKQRFLQHMAPTGDSKVYKSLKENEDNIVYYSYALLEDDYSCRLYEMLYTYMYKPKLSDIKVNS